jgi:flagellar hook-associated protein 2
MVDIKPQFFTNTGSASSERRLTPEAPSRPADPTMNSPTGAKTQRAAESVDTRVSVKARILNAVGGFKSSVAAVTGTDFKMTSSAPRMVSIGIANPALTTAFSASMTIRQLAAPQIIVFRLAQSAKPDTVLQHSAGLVTLASVQPNPPGQSQQAGQTLRIGSGNDTIKGLVQSLNGLSGLKASLLQTREGLALLVKTRPGPPHALEPASIAALRRLLQPALPSGPQPLVVSTGGVAAKDTLGELNGRPFVHASTTMDTLVSGYHITAHAPGQARLQSEETIASLQKRMAALLREMNTLITFLATTAQRGTGTATAPSLSDRMIAHVLLDRLRKIVSRPIHGFGPDPVLPADLGIGVDAAQFLTLNEERFTRIAKHRRNMVAAIIGPAEGQDGAAPAQGWPHLPAVGVHRLVYDPTHSPVIAMLNETPLAKGRDAWGRPVLTLRTQTQELSIVLKAEEPITTDIIYGQSLLDQVTDFAAAVLDPDDPLIRADAASDAKGQAGESEAAPADIMVAAMYVRQIAQGDAAQSNAIATLPPEAAEIVVYLLWIGLFIPDVKRDRHKKRRTHTPHGWRRKRPHPR